ncbi:membrane protein [Longilinea arvoryzae]|uniref:Membrane protein n=1 Tax=Longilinea arvoryzae TaxID=360412 RepID=A0A0S7BAG2_9CHLR|nr:lipopolysaccharide biosynthesis protein [Longilinea arvoryzae]GAP14503.1 membrane protein [Longilinea arvoryzae]
MEDTQKLAKSTLKGTLWNYTSFAVSKGLTFISTLILARILVPDDFGLLSMGLIAINYLDALNEMGVGSALIYQQGDLEKKSNIAFTISLSVNALLTLLAFLSAPAIGAFFNEPRIIPIVQVLSFSFVLSSIGSIHSVRLKKELNFRKVFVPEIGRTFAKGGISIVCALLGWGVWSLVIGQVSGILVSNVLYWVVVPYRPRLAWDRQEVKGLLGYGSQIILVDLLGMFLQNIDYLIIGKRMESTQLGYYTMAFRIPELVIINICVVVSRALFPAFSRIQNNLEALRKGYLTTLRYISLITIPIGLGLFLLSKEFILMFYTDKWSASIPVMQLLCLYAVVYALGFNAGDIYKATGKPWILNAMGAAKLVISVPILWAAAGISIYAVAAAQLAINIFLTLVELLVVAWIVKIKAVDILKSMQPAILSGLIMFIGVYILKSQMMGLQDWTRIIALPIAGALLYGVTLWLTHRDVLRSFFQLAKGAVQA